MIRKVACIGFGTIGSGWAALFAWNGLEVSVFDLNKDFIQNSMKNVERALFLMNNLFENKGKVETILKRIRVAETLEMAIEDADYVQESAAENYGTKKELFGKMDKVLRKDVIIATSTSGLKISEIQKAAEKHPERCITVHPYNPPYVIPLVEIVPGEKTSKETVNTTYEFMETLGKKPIVVQKNIPGMVANRLAAALWREAVNLVISDIASPEEIDKAIKYGPGIRWPITGIFLTYHLGGGLKGMEHFLSFFKSHFENLWKDLANWTEYPPNSFEKILEKMESYAAAKRTYEELTEERDKKIANLLKIMD
ncbi:MAG: 3-hydroxyacyl-CoA dehydrogenase family protein [Archaeoglobaceae archaeon]